MDIMTLGFTFAEYLQTFRDCADVQRHFCYWNGGFACLPENHTEEPHPILMKLEACHYKYGLTSDEWSVLVDRATKVWKGPRE